MNDAHAVRLGVNIDHLATIRNARGGTHPCPVRAAQVAQDAGADGITAHLREDRRHIRDGDIAALAAAIAVPLNLEMAATPQMLDIALAHLPHACCLVPERREELTTEGGLDAAGERERLAPCVRRLADAGVRVSIFVDPEPAQLDAVRGLGAPVAELHTGAYCGAVERGDARAAAELDRLRRAATHGRALGLEIHAGHGLTFASAGPVAAITEVAELNIGHFLVAEAIFEGLAAVIGRMKMLIREVRAA